MSKWPKYKWTLDIFATFVYYFFMIHLILGKEYGIYKMLLETCNLNVLRDASIYIVGFWKHVSWMLEMLLCTLLGTLVQWTHDLIFFPFVGTWLEENPSNKLSHGLIKFSIYHPFVEFWQGCIPLGHLKLFFFSPTLFKTLLFFRYSQRIDCTTHCFS